MNMRVAIVGPWPPESSGIADYSADLAAQLESIGTILTRIDRTINFAVAKDLLSAQDIVVYQLGNNAAHHAWMLPLMAQVPGVIHLHDVILHHFVVTVMHEYSQLNSQSYGALIEDWYPREVRCVATEAFDRAEPVWEGEKVSSIPLFEPLVRMATGVVVHSEFAAKAVSQSFPYIPVQLVPQWYTSSHKRRRRISLKIISVMGGGEPNRRFDWIADAIIHIHDSLTSPLVIEIVGELNPAVEPDIKRMVGLDRIELKLLGRVNEKEFADSFYRADLLIAFRHPTMGETSAIVSKALQYGLPTIVSDQGWYAELPDCVHKVNVDDEASLELATFLKKQLGQEAVSIYGAWAERCYELSECYLNGARQAARKYVSFLAEVKASARVKTTVAELLASWNVDPDGALAGAIAGIDVQCNFMKRPALYRVVSAAIDSAWQVIDKVAGTSKPQGPLEDGDFKCLLDTQFDDVNVSPGGDLEFSVSVKNLSDVAYSSPRPSQPDEFGIFIGHHWRKHGVGSSFLERPRIRLKESVAPGGGLCSQSVRLAAPSEIGSYDLIIDLIQENVSWFRDRGGKPIIIEINVQ